MKFVRIAFPYVPRAHPYVLTHHDFQKMCAGRRLSEQELWGLLALLAGRPWDVKTFGQLKRALAEKVDEAEKAGLIALSLTQTTPAVQTAQEPPQPQR